MSCCQDSAHGQVMTAPAKPASAKSGCKCEQCCGADTCCDLVCFERPNYFCGHLLTDADLLHEQTYFREKNKLYHRALHGHGIVCGLRIMCDGECDGYVRIEQGFAIDDCGNDLVVCRPLRFNVLKALRDKGWVLEQGKPDPCKPGQKDEECHTRQCFYVAACYDEEQGDFIAPFVPGCKPQPADCEPTRVRETVTFDVLKELPPKTGGLDAAMKRVTDCFALFSKGQFAQYLQQHAPDIEKVLGAPLPAGSQPPANPPAPDKVDCRQIFCDLRGLLLLHLKKHPDRYNCRLEADIRAIPMPKGEGVEECHAAICKLIGLATNYVYACALNEFIPHCAEPAKAGCVVLGTVEVVDGDIIKVCNCPRDYVWSFGNFFEVLVATLVSGALCTSEAEGVRGEIGGAGAPIHSRHVCCNEIDVRCEETMRHLRVNREALMHRGVAAFQAAAELRQAFAGAFNFTRADVYAPAMFNGLTSKEAVEAARKLSIVDARVTRAQAAAPPVTPFELLRRFGLATEHDSLVLVEENDIVKQSYAEVPLTAVNRVARMPKQAAQDLESLHQRVAALEARLATPPTPPTPPTGSRRST